MKALLRSTAGNVHIAHGVMCVLVLGAGLFGMTHLGGAMAGAIAGEGAAHAPAAATMVVSSQAATEDLVRIAEAAMEGVRAIPKLELEPIAPTELLRGGARFTPAEVRGLRAVAHELWENPRGPNPRAWIDVGNESVEVGPVPLLRTESMLAKVPLPEGFNPIPGRRLNTGLLVRLDEALNAVFARGVTGNYDTKHLSMLGDERELSENFKRTFRPSGVWSFLAHGSPWEFARNVLQGGKLVEQRLDFDHVVSTLYAKGYRGGQPLLLPSCQTGACSNSRNTIAQRLSDQLMAPVVAPSNTLHMGSDGHMVVRPADSGAIGEWRLFQPKLWQTDEAAAHERLVVGRKPFEDEKALASVHELWRAPRGSASLIEFAGDPVLYTGQNAGAFAAAWHALERGGRVVVRTETTRAAADIERTLRVTGFDLLRSVEGDHLTVIATKR